ncbi:dihydrolipoyllysine-residue acetyltransferase, partial [Yersinia pestis PY-04]
MKAIKLPWKFLH